MSCQTNLTIPYSLKRAPRRPRANDEAYDEGRRQAKALEKTASSRGAIVSDVRDCRG